MKKHTVGSETSQYHEEKRLISISLVAASENECEPKPKNCPSDFQVWSCSDDSRGYKAVMEFNFQEVTNRQIAEAPGKERPRG